MTSTNELDTLIATLWSSDEASALTNQAARMLEELRAKLEQNKITD